MADIVRELRLIDESGDMLVLHTAYQTDDADELPDVLLTAQICKAKDSAAGLWVNLSAAQVAELGRFAAEERARASGPNPF
jgi:hypothetical protein